jgi:hypothetical protein
MRLLFIVAFIGLFASCADLQKKEQLAKIDVMNKTLDSLEKELIAQKIDTIPELKLATSTVELRIKKNLFLDKVDVELGKKMDAYKRMRRALGPLGKAYGKVKKSISEMREALKNLYSDIENGYGEREKYEEYITFEKDKISKLTVLLNDYKEQKESVFKTYFELHDELYTFSMDLMKKNSKSTK